MNKILTISALVSMLAICTPLFLHAGDRAPDLEKVKQQQVVIPTLQNAVTVATKYASSNIKVQSTAHQITVIIINSKLNNGSRIDRQTEAALIVATIAKGITNKPEFLEVGMIHVDYVMRNGKKTNVIQGIDFNKAPNGTFQIHTT